MSQFDLFKHDVRVRERMLRKGLMTEAEQDAHLSGLHDLESQCDRLALQQPALGRSEVEPHSERLTPAVPPVPAPSFESARVEAPPEPMRAEAAPEPASAPEAAPEPASAPEAAPPPVEAAPPPAPPEAPPVAFASTPSSAPPADDEPPSDDDWENTP
jgi:hypothetical protein